MTNEDKILELLMGMQKDIVGLKKGQEILVAGQERLEARQERLEARQERLEAGQENIVARLDCLEVKVTSVDAMVETLAQTQVADIYALTKMTYDKMTKLDSKLGVLNNRLFDQEAEIQNLKLVK